jgi:dCTP deaminase
MGLIPDYDIRRLVTIEPFAEEAFRPGVISYGVSSYGYDARLGDTFRVMTTTHYRLTGRRMDPKNFPADLFDVVQGPHVDIPANSFALAETLEYFEIPRNVLAVCLGKSTYARCGIIVNVTPLEPEWRGKITVEISNTTPIAARVYAGEGIMQIIFLLAGAECEKSYADKKGKYQDQKGLTLPVVVQ